MKQENNDNVPAASRWQADHFAVHNMMAEYVGSFEEAADVLDTMQYYQVEYDTELFAAGDALAVRLYVKVNSQILWPGYRIACMVQTDYVLPGFRGLVTTGMVAPEDMEFFILDTHESMQDFLMSFTHTMPLGAYILPPPDLEGTILKKVRNFIDV